MKKHEYRRAVSSIRWSEAKRSEIEEKLAEPVRKKAVKGSKAKIVKYEERDYMKQEREARRLNKMYLIMILASMLAIGGTIAGIAMSEHKKTTDKHNSIDLEDSTETPPDLENARINPNLTNQTDTPECSEFAETDNGFFYTESVDYSAEEHKALQKEVGLFYNSPKGLKYYDKDAGKAVFVCAKPNCLHNRSEFCTATTKNYSISSNPVWLDGYVYAVANDNREFLQNPEGCTKFPTVLLRWSPDGTELTAVAQLALSEKLNETRAELTAHRGQLWISCSYNQQFNTFDENMMITNQDTYGKSAIYCYEPENAKLTALCSNDDWQKGYYIYSGAPTFRGLKGIGTYVYFFKPNNDWRDPVKGTGVFRIDCRTGLIEQIVKAKQDACKLYTVSNRRVYYALSGESEKYGKIGPECAVKAHDIVTGEETELTSLWALATEQAPWLTKELIEDTSRNNASIYLSQMIAAKDRLYIIWWLDDYRETGSVQYEANWGKSYFYLTELDLSGNELRTVNLYDTKNMELPEEWIRNKVQKDGYWCEEKTWIAPDKMTEEDIMTLRSSGGWLKEDGEWLDPRKMKNEDIEEYEKTGFYITKYVSYKPEELTEEIIQRAIDNWENDSFTDGHYEEANIEFNGEYFYLPGVSAVYRMTPDEIFGEMRAERLYYYHE